MIASGGGGPSAPPAQAPAAAPATSALAIVTEPAGASIYVDGTARGVAPLNLAANVGAEVEIRAELAGHMTTRERVRVGAEPATVRLALGVIVDAGAPVADAAPPAPIDAGAIDAGARPRRERPRPTRTAPDTFDPDGVIGP